MLLHLLGKRRESSLIGALISEGAFLWQLIDDSFIDRIDCLYLKMRIV